MHAIETFDKIFKGGSKASHEAVVASLHGELDEVRTERVQDGVRIQHEHARGCRNQVVDHLVVVVRFVVPSAESHLAIPCIVENQQPRLGAKLIDDEVFRAAV